MGSRSKNPHKNTMSTDDENFPILISNNHNHNSPNIIMSSFSTSSSSLPGNGKSIGITAILILIVAAMLDSFFVVPPGMVGVIVTLGHVQTAMSGVHFKKPFLSEVVILDTKTQKLEEENNTPTKEGLNVELDTVVLFRLDPTKAGDIYKTIGENYIHLLLSPEASSAVRGLTSESDAKALYSSGRSMIQDTLKTELEAKLGPKGIIIQDVLLKDLKLPALVQDAIQLKAKAAQDAQRMEFVLQKEQQEAQRKTIEAKGIADFQHIVSEGISAQLLQWKGIEATEKFANSANTKLVLIGNGSGDLPVILSAEDNAKV